MPQIDAFMMLENNKTVVIAVGAASATTLIPGQGEFLSLTNQAAAGGVIIFVETCQKPNAVAAVVATSLPVLPATTRIIRRKPGDDSISTIGSAAGPTNLSVTPGNGT